MILVLCVNVSTYTTVFAIENDPTATEIKAAIDLMGKQPSWSSKAKIEQFIPEVIVPELVFAIRNHPAYREGVARSFAYTALLNLGAARFPVGLEQMMIGLSEQNVGVECARALVIASKDKHALVVESLGKILEDEKSSRNLLYESVQTLSRLQHSKVNRLKNKVDSQHPANQLFQRIEHIFTSSGSDVSLRWVSAHAMMTIGGVEKSLPILHATNDIPGKKAVLHALKRYGAETKGSFDVDPIIRTEIRGIVIDILLNDEIELRKLALEAILGIYGDEIYIESSEGFDINPALLSKLENAASKEQNSSLKKNIIEIINYLPQTLSTKNKNID